MPTDHRFVTCDVGDVTAPDATTIDHLARLALAARRSGRQLRIVGASEGLRALLAFAGLSEALPCDGSGVESVGQPEQREQALGVEERVQGDDLAP